MSPICVPVDLYYDVATKEEARRLALDHVEGLMMEHGGIIEAFHVDANTWDVDQDAWAEIAERFYGREDES